MPNASTLGFVLGSEPFKEQDKLVHLLTYDRGILKAIAPGALKGRNRFGSMLEMFCEGEYQYHWKEDREMITLTRGDLVASYFTIVSDPANIFYFYLMAETLLKFVPYDHKDKRIYRLVSALLEARSEGGPMDMLLLYFLAWILRIEGMMFNPRTCHNCFERGITSAWFKTDFQGILCPKCRTNENVALNPHELSFLIWLETHSPKDLKNRTDPIDTAKLIRTLKNKIEHHGEFNLKSTQYLAEFR